MKKTLTAFALVLFTAATASAGPINFGFEDGLDGLDGWFANTNGGDYLVVTEFDDLDPISPMIYTPQEGVNFLALGTGGDFAGPDAVVSQQFHMDAGESLTGSVAFTTTDYLPFDDNAKAIITVLSGPSAQVVWSQSVSGVGDHGSSPWTTWTFTALDEGFFIVSYTVANDDDEFNQSYALFDAAPTATVPDGGSALALLGLGMIGLSTLRRKLF